MKRLLAVLSTTAILGLSGVSLGQTTGPSQGGGCEQVGRTGCKPDPSFGHKGTPENCEGRTGCGGTETLPQQGAAQTGCEQVGRTGCKPDPSFGHGQPQLQGTPPATGSINPQ